MTTTFFFSNILTEKQKNQIKLTSSGPESLSDDVTSNLFFGIVLNNNFNQIETTHERKAN